MNLGEQSITPVDGCPACWATLDPSDNRWDPTFVQVEAVENLRNIFEFGKRHHANSVVSLYNLRDSITNGATPKGASLEEGDVLFLTAEHIDMFDIAFSTGKRITIEQLRQQMRSKVAVGDLLMTIKGKIGAVHIVHDLPGEVAINQDVAKLHLNDLADPHYVALYLASRPGQVELRRKATGLINPFLGLGSLDKVPVPLPYKTVQRQLGDLVRQAVGARAVASRLLQEAATLFYKAVDLVTLEEKLSALEDNLWNWVSIADVKGRYDAEFFQKRHQTVLKHIQAYMPTRLEQLIERPRKGRQPEYVSNLADAGSVPALNGSEIDPYCIDKEKAGRISQVSHRVNSSSALEVNDILLTVTGPPLGEAALVRKHHLPSNINTHIVRIKTKTNVYPGYLTLVFNSRIGRMQVYRWCRGIRQKDIYPDQILEFVFPLLDEDSMKLIDQKIKLAEDKREEAQCILREALREIENLVEGRTNAFP